MELKSEGRPAAGTAFSGVSWRALALPAEHGGWGLLAEPLLVGLILAPEPSSLLFALSSLFGFLARHPGKLAVSDLWRGVKVPRTRAAFLVAFAYAFVAAVLLALAASLARGPILPWLGLIVPLALAQFGYDVRLKGRALAPELAGAMALSGTAAAMVSGAGRETALALSAWALVALRCLSSIVYVRAKLRLERGLAADAGMALGLHAGAVAVLSVLASSGRLPWLAAVAFALLLARAIHGLAEGKSGVRPKVLGFRELGFGLASTLLIALGLAGY